MQEWYDGWHFYSVVFLTGSDRVPVAGLESMQVCVSVCECVHQCMYWVYFNGVRLHGCMRFSVDMSLQLNLNVYYVSSVSRLQGGHPADRWRSRWPASTSGPHLLQRPGPPSLY